MPTKHPDIFEALLADFHRDQVRFKPPDDYPYVTTRTVMNRLDKVLGPENWEDDYHDVQGGLACVLRVTINDMTITKTGVAALTPDPPFVQEPKSWQDLGPYELGEKRRSAHFVRCEDIRKNYEATAAEAFKRAAVKWGVGRGLYNEGLPDLKNEQDSSPAEAPAQWKNPETGRPLADSLAKPPAPEPIDDSKFIDQINVDPKAGTADVWQWVMALERRYKIGAVTLVNKVLHEKGIPRDYKTWDQKTVGQFCNYLRRYASRTDKWKEEHADPVDEFSNGPPPREEVNATLREVKAYAMSLGQDGGGVNVGRDRVKSWATVLALREGVPSGVYPAERIAQIVSYHSHGMIKDVEHCDDINVLDRTTTALLEAAR